MFVTRLKIAAAVLAVTVVAPGDGVVAQRLLAQAPAPAADAPAGVKHPNLLVNRAEIEEAKEKIKKYPWAAKLFEQVKEMAGGRRGGGSGRLPHSGPREAALCYVLTGETHYGEAARREVVGSTRGADRQFGKVDLRVTPELGAWSPWATLAWSYDLTYDLYTPEERESIEAYLRKAAHIIIEGDKILWTTPNLEFEKHWKIGLVGYCLGDKELIDWALNDPGVQGPRRGGFYPTLDSMINDTYFWGEAPIYAVAYDVHGMLALAEAARHYDGTDLYHYVSKKSGASIKSLIDGYLRMSFPREKTGIGGGSVRLATFGDGSTQYTPRGELLDSFAVNPVSDEFGTMTLAGELEVAYKRYKDPGYAWLLSLEPKRDHFIGTRGQAHNRPVWGFTALMHGDPLPERPEPPPAPCGIYPSQGFAMIRSDESPRYWDAGGLAAVVMLNKGIGHGHKDHFGLILHGKGRLLYPDLNITQYEPDWLNWTREGIAHNTLLVDQQSPQPGPFSTRHEFAEEAKFFALSGSAYEGVEQTRAMLMTGDYLADVFRAADVQHRERTFDWVLHGLGRLYPGNPGAYRPTHELLPFYWWIDNERGRKTDGAWQVDWVQQSAGVAPGVQRFGKEWFEQAVGVRMTMLGAAGNEVYVGDGPLVSCAPYHRIDGNREGTCPMVVARRRAAGATFAAVHEPYDKQSIIQEVRRIQETDQAVGMAIDSAAFSDRVLVAFEPDKQQALRSADGEAFCFSDHGYLRIMPELVKVCGTVTAFRVRAKTDKLVLNGKAQAAQRQGDFLVFGALPADADKPQAGPGDDDPREHQATLHYSFQPEEVHLRSGSEKKISMYVRCVGRGTARGRLRLAAAPGISVAPAVIDLDRLAEGDEKVVPLRLKAAAGAANKLHYVRIEPEKETPATAGKLAVSVGVVITEDNCRPMLSQSIVRAPGYTIAMDHFSGTSFYLLDAEGRRRHNSILSRDPFGLVGIERDGKWLLRYRTPCDPYWPSPNSLVVGCHEARLRYTFRDDRIILEIIPPTNPTLDQTVWLGNFETLTPRLYHGVRQEAAGSRAADLVFFPHPTCEQGLLLQVPEHSPVLATPLGVNFPLRVGQEASLRFATGKELPGPGEALEPAPRRR